MCLGTELKFAMDILIQRIYCLNIFLNLKKDVSNNIFTICLSDLLCNASLLFCVKFVSSVLQELFSAKLKVYRNCVKKVQVNMLTLYVLGHLKGLRRQKPKNADIWHTVLGNAEQVLHEFNVNQTKYLFYKFHQGKLK